MEDLTILGKFKSVKALKEAYDNLQREFTKKCQKLSQMMEAKEDNFEAKQDGQAEETLSGKNALPKPSISQAVFTMIDEDNSEDKNLQKAQVDEVIPQKLQSKIPSGVDNLDGSVPKTPDDNPCLTIDEVFAEKYLLNNPEFMELVLKRYLKQFSTCVAPSVIGGSGTFSLTPPTKPSSITEAGLLASRLFDR